MNHDSILLILSFGLAYLTTLAAFHVEVHLVLLHNDDPVLVLLLNWDRT